MSNDYCTDSKQRPNILVLLLNETLDTYDHLDMQLSS